MQRLTNETSHHRATHKQNGLTMIELVLALIVIGISSATIAKLLVTSLNFAETNRSYAEDLRAAESCYETILAVYEMVGKAQSVPGVCPSDPASTNKVSLDTNELENWASLAANEKLFEDEGNPYICKNEIASCQSEEIDNEDVTQFSISIRGNQYLKLIVPMN